MFPEFPENHFTTKEIFKFRLTSIVQLGNVISTTAFNLTRTNSRLIQSEFHWFNVYNLKYLFQFSSANIFIVKAICTLEVHNATQNKHLKNKYYHVCDMMDSSLQLHCFSLVLAFVRGFNYFQIWGIFICSSFEPFYSSFVVWGEWDGVRQLCLHICLVHSAVGVCLDACWQHDWREE